VLVSDAMGLVATGALMQPVGGQMPKILSCPHVFGTPLTTGHSTPVGSWNAEAT